jgi:hypothetical protein
MGSPPDAPEALLQERAYLSLLLLVGAGAVAIGAYQTARSSSASLSSIFDLALGICVLLVTWLFLAPTAWPALFGDVDPRTRPVRRPYLGPNPTPLVRPPPRAEAIPTAPVPAVIPRWADPLVRPRPVEARPVADVHSQLHTVASAPSRLRQSAVPTDEDPPTWEGFDLPSAVPTDPEEFRTPRWDPEPSNGRGTPSIAVLEELDRIETALRDFVPSDPPVGRSAPGGLEDLTD